MSNKKNKHWITPAEYGRKYDIQSSLVYVHLSRGRVPGAVQGKDGLWRIPCNAEDSRKYRLTPLKDEE